MQSFRIIDKTDKLGTVPSLRFGVATWPVKMELVANVIAIHAYIATQWQQGKSFTATVTTTREYMILPIP